MATTKLQSDELVTLVADVRFNGELYEAGLNFLGSDELVKSRPKLFARFALGHREVVAVHDALERAEFAEFARQAQARAAVQAEEEPAQPPKVVAVKQFNHGGETITVGSVWLKSHAVVESAPAAFAPVIQD